MEGTAKIGLEVTPSGFAREEVSLSLTGTGRNSDSVTIRDYRLTLLQLDPNQTHAGESPPDYVASLLTDKLATSREN